MKIKDYEQNPGPIRHPFNKWKELRPLDLQHLSLCLRETTQETIPSLNAFLLAPNCNLTSLQVTFGPNRPANNNPANIKSLFSTVKAAGKSLKSFDIKLHELNEEMLTEVLKSPNLTHLRIEAEELDRAGLHWDDVNEHWDTAIMHSMEENYSLESLYIESDFYSADSLDCAQEVAHFLIRNKIHKVLENIKQENLGYGILPEMLEALGRFSTTEMNQAFQLLSHDIPIPAWVPSKEGN